MLAGDKPRLIDEWQDAPVLWDSVRTYVDNDGRYALLEFKLGSAEIEEGANHLIKIRELVREYNRTEKQIKLGEPDLLIVITGGQMAYSRPDGVKIIPLACLKD